jgi:hypothetical protein
MLSGTLRSTLIRACSFLAVFLSLIPTLAMPSKSSAEEAEALLFSITVPLVEGKDVLVNLPNGSAKTVGKVVALPDKTRWPSYTATKWGKPGTVAASAVNAIHLLIGIDKGKGRTMSITPLKTIAPAAGPGASIVVDSPPGEGMFGAWAPAVGNPVMVIGEDGIEAPLSESRIPKPGDSLVIKVTKDSVPYLVEIENRPGGRVIAYYSSYRTELIGRVLRPVEGVGRFEGTLFQDVGRIRANHPGVIDISTSPNGEIGGFQIIPWEHSRSPEMLNLWNMTQWMVIAPEDGRSPMGGTPPLFLGGLVPGPASSESLWDIWSTYGRRPLVLCRIQGGPWQKLPVAVGKDDHALKGLTHLRIYFPTYDEPLKSDLSQSQGD